MRSALLVAASALAGLVGAQVNYSTSGPLTINVSQVDPTLRGTWCSAQETSCPQLCGGMDLNNTCDSTTLEFNCTCPGSQQPNISNFDQTIPYFICAQWRINCVANHPNDLNGQAACHSVVCGMQNASEVESNASSSASASSSSTASMTGSSSTASQTGTATASSSGSSASPTKGAAVALSVAKNYGTGIMAVGLLALFGLAL